MSSFKQLDYGVSEYRWSGLHEIVKVTHPNEAQEETHIVDIDGPHNTQTQYGDSDFIEEEYAVDQEEESGFGETFEVSAIWWTDVNTISNQGDLEDNENEHGDDDLESLASDEEIGGVRHGKKQFTPRSEWADFKFELGLEFASKEQLREALREHFIATDKDFQHITNNSIKIRAICKGEGCDWLLYARVQTKDNTTFRINKLVNAHNCGIVLDNKKVTATWLARHFIHDFRMNPNMSYNNFTTLTTKTKFSNTTPGVFYSTRRKARIMLEGTVKDQYRVLEDYCKQILLTNPGSTTTIKCNIVEDKRLFERVYICLKACKDGFKVCRPLIGLDGCFLKGYCKGMLLAAVGIDANNSMFPIAWAVCEKENTETWNWFLNLLKEDLNITDPRTFTMISDRQKGLENALSSLLDGAEIRFCVRHLHANFKKEFPGLLLKQKLRACAKATTPEEFKIKMVELKEVNEKAYQWLMNKAPTEWSKSHFRLNVKCDMLLNNLCESFNAAILDARDKPIITLLESIRFRMMSIIDKKRQIASNWGKPVCKHIVDIIEKNKKVASHCSSTRSNAYIFQVTKDGNESFACNLSDRTCTCRSFQLTGIPCGHAIAAIWTAKLNWWDFVDSAYKVETFQAQYAGMIGPMPSPDKWLDPGLNPVYPPTETCLPGRPKKKRRKAPDEDPPNATKMRRFGQINHCSNCKQVGHSSRTCKNPKVTQHVTPTKMGRPPLKNPQPDTLKRKRRMVKKNARDAAATQNTSLQQT